MRDRITGIGRVSAGVIESLLAYLPTVRIQLAVNSENDVPVEIREKIQMTVLPKRYFMSELALSNLSRRSHLYISLYRKLPLFGCFCRSINTVHDILDITHFTSGKKWKSYLDIYRTKYDLYRANVTWFDSFWSKRETQRVIGFCGSNPKVRYPAIEERLPAEPKADSERIFDRYGLPPGYTLVLGNGLPHKNLGVLLCQWDKLGRPLVIVGASKNRRSYWLKRFPSADAIWLDPISDEHLPTIYRQAFCLAQPSIIEGYGYPPLEAMAVGTPVVISDIEVLRETTGGYALKADPCDPKQWRNAIQSLESDTVRKKIIDDGKRWVSRRIGKRAWRGHIEDVAGLLGWDMPFGNGCQNDVY